MHWANGHLHPQAQKVIRSHLSPAWFIIDLQLLPHKVGERDFLAHGADALKIALEADVETARKLADALKIFGEMEQKTRDLVMDKILAS